MRESDHRALTEAARWFASRHRGVMTVEAKAEYETWRSRPENSDAMDELERAWLLAGQASGNAHHPVHAAAAGRRIFARTAVLALMCVVSLGVGIVSYSGHSAFWTTLDWVER